MSNFQVLYRKDAEFPYLVIFYDDLQGSSRTTPATFYAFQQESGSAIMHKDHAPTQVQNIHGSDVYQSYLDRGWKDITQSEYLYPWAIKSWLAHQSERKEVQAL